MRTEQELRAAYPGVSPEITGYVEDFVFPEYALNDAGHGIEHIRYVVRRSLGFAANLPEDEPPVDLDMVFLVAAYHDLAAHVDRDRHEILSAQYLKSDSFLPGRFSPEQMRVMAEAIEDHRGSSDHDPRSIYGRIVSTADRATDMDDFMRRMYAYRRKRFPEMDLAEIEEDTRRHILEKYGDGGYGRKRTYFYDQEFAGFCEEAQRLCSDPEAFHKRFRAANHIPVNA